MTKGIPTTFNELKSQLSTNFKPTKTASGLHSEIRSIKQKGNVSGFKEKIDKLISELTLVQYTDLEDSSNETARSTIRMMNEKLALETFQEGLQENIRIAVVAAQPKTLIQAYEIASTQERLLQTTNKLEIFHISNNSRHSYNTNNNYNSNNNNNRDNNQRTNRYNNQKTNRYNNQRTNRYNNQRTNRYNNHRRPDFNTINNRHNNNNNYNQYNNRNFNNQNRSITNHNIHDRNNRRHSYPNVRVMNQQGNEESLENRSDSPEREN